MKIKGTFILFFSSLTLLQAQEKLMLYEDSLKKIAPVILRGKSEAERSQANSSFQQILDRALDEPGAYEYPFDSLKTISRLSSPDKEFRLFNWNMRLDDGTYRYFCYLKSPQHLVVFTDKTQEIKNPESAALSPSKWYGAHYYDIIKVKRRKKIHYILLGWKGVDYVSSQKVIEVLRFNRNGEVQLGHNVFEIPKKDPKRIVFEHSAEVSMSLKYQDSQNRIIFDHLSPRSSDLTGQFQFYAPDMSYDAFRLKKGKWIYEEDIDARNPGNIHDKLFKEPK